MFQPLTCGVTDAEQEWTVNDMRLIDADALGVGRCSRDLLPASYCAGWNGLVNLIEQAPTIDAVPVVRCKDCVLHRNCLTEDTFNLCRIENPFCCGGKRKDGDG